ncbi:biopolymer transporter ExbD [Vibrio sp. TH_r3]|uniref:ExbD/TolR family protein n=1 Tax=unclassified Vibrio TaxID=2614977 RepID=UPI002954BC7A|nr:biopolymer transporter ExbD [Vibrio sp. TH_r3]MDV7103796.1 biopolymer transporter ExbD [Vibrio sp. TH_r3]
MRLGHRRKTQDEAQIDMTSMLDIVFIMLIFFIVTSSFVNESGVEVNRPQATNSVSKKEASIFVAITENNDIYIDKRLVDKERVQATLEQLLTETNSPSLVVQADELAFNGTVVSVLDAAKGAGIVNIALATENN